MSVIVASQPGKYISESPGMGSVESKIVQRLCIWTNSLLVILEIPDLEKIHLTKDIQPKGSYGSSGNVSWRISATIGG